MDDTMKEFMNPKSMLTPGLAGGMTMMITNALCAQFAVLPRPYIALSISLLFGLLIMASNITPPWKRLGYYLLNSLVIFSVAAGANTVGVAATSPAKQTGPLAFIGVSAAYAQSGNESTGSTDNGPHPPSRRGERESRPDPRTGYAGNIGRTEMPRLPPVEQGPQRKDGRFFTPWF